MSTGWSTKKSCSLVSLLSYFLFATFKARLMDFSTSIFWGKLQCIVSFCFSTTTLAFVPSKASNWFPTDLLLFVVLCHVYINSKSSTENVRVLFPLTKSDTWSLFDFLHSSVWEKSGEDSPLDVVLCSNNSSKYRTYRMVLKDFQSPTQKFKIPDLSVLRLFK